MSAKVYCYEELCALIKPILKKYNAAETYIFGSYAKGNARPESDIDLLVKGGKDFILKDIFAIAEELSVKSGKSVDVYELCEIDASSEFGKAVLAEGVSVA